jgi:hyperosmotically inducible periplasmic protein
MLKRISVLFCVAAFALTTPGYAYAQGDAAADAATTASVKTKLLADTKVGGLGIDVDTKDNVVTLSGKVRTAAEKNEAVRLARTTTGVKSVVDKLVIDPAHKGTTNKDEKAKAEIKDESKDAKGTAGRAADKSKDAANQTGEVVTDATITSAVKSKLLGDPDVSGLKIDVDTSNGVVTLSGVVNTAAERTEALRLTRETKGVKNVKNNLKLQPKGTDTTTATTGRTDKDDKLTVEVKDDTKESAAKVKDASKKGAEKTQDAAIKAKDVTADASITSAVKTKLLADPQVGGLAIDVDTKDNIVTLTGTVKTAAEKAEAVRLAKTTTGVKSVVDKLTIKP